MRKRNRREILEKLSEINLQGLSPESVVEGSQPLPPMETAGFSKARDILGRAQQIKTAAHITGTGSAVGLPRIQKMQEAEKKDDSLAGKAQSLAGHTLAGAGAGRLVGWASHGPTLGVTDAAKQSLHGRQWYGTAIGAGIGAGMYGMRKLRERQKQAEMTKLSFSPGQALKRTQQVARTHGKGLRSGPGIESQTPLLGRRFTMKKHATGNPGVEDLARVRRMVRTREDTRAEADVLFGDTAKKMRAEDRSKLEKLFVQTPASQTMAPNLQKAAAAYLKTKRAYEIKPEDRPSIAKKDFAQPNKEEAGHEGKYPIPDRQHAKSALGFAKMHGDSAAYAAVRAKVKAKYPDMLEDEKEKKSSLTSNLDAFFEKLSAASVSDAQRRYPELLKVAYANPTTKTPDLKKRVQGTDDVGTVPVRSGLSGGSA